ncbi:MAG: hypothetical protein HC817_14465 [Saprospiraceae bacterium]|nr:hypothetical protein [Saprospiraceae bacterium]
MLTRGDSCGTITVSPAEWWIYPKKVTYNFGAGCKGKDGKFRAGELILNIGKVWEPNSVVSAEYKNYVEDTLKLDGKFTLTNNSVPGAANFNFKANDIKVTNKIGQTLSYNLDQTFKQVEGLNDWNWFNDAYDISGTASAILPDGKNIMLVNCFCLRKSNVCNWVQQGLGNLKIDNNLITVDYGGNVCDNDAVLTINGTKFPIKL